MAVMEDVDTVLSVSALPVDCANVTFEPDFDELSFCPLLPLLTEGEVILYDELVSEKKTILLVTLSN